MLWTLVFAQVSMYDGIKQTQTQVMVMVMFILQNTTSVTSFWYSWSFGGYFVLCAAKDTQK